MAEKLLVVFTSYGPYHLARASALARAYPDSVFLEIAGAQRDYQWKKGNERLPFRLITLFGGIKAEDVPVFKLQIRMLKILNEVRPDVVVYHGLMEPGFKTIAGWTRIHKIPSILHFDSWYGDRPRQAWKQTLKGIIYRYFYEAAFVSGERSRTYVESFGFPAEKIWTGCDVVDNDFFSIKSDIARSNEDLRDKENLPSQYFLCIGRFIWEKDHVTLLTAYKSYLMRGGTWHLVLVGGGPLKHAIEAIIDKLALNEYIILKDWTSVERMPHYYAFAGCLVLPSISETWGLVVNEAAACGLPLILSNKCGCVPELCHHGKNGFVFQGGNADELAGYMLKMSGGDVNRAEYGQKSRDLVSDLTPEKWATRVSEIVHSIKR